MATKKEKCFQEAFDRLNEARGNPVKVGHQKGWVKDWKEGWREESWREGLWHSIRKTLRIQKRDPNTLPREPGKPNPLQFRRPDVTITQPDGTKVVLDTKFTRADGKPDKWSTKPGMSGSSQREDYEGINQEQESDMGEPKIDKDNCDCSRRKLEPEKVVKKVPSFVEQAGKQFFVMPEPGAVPALPSPGQVPVRVPIRIPIPVFP